MRMSKASRLVDEEDSRYSLMQVPMPGSLVPPAKSRTEHGRVGQLDGAASEPRQAPHAHGKKHAAAIPTPLEDGNKVRKNSHDISPKEDPVEEHDSSDPAKEKRFGLADSEAWESVSRSLSQQHRLSSIVASPKETELPLEPIASPSRTSSQRRSLDRFTRQLEKYYLATSGEAKMPISTPTLTESRASVHTVVELLPYHSEFQATGLAVTSEEQTPEKKQKKKQRPVVDENNPDSLRRTDPKSSITVSHGRTSGRKPKQSGAAIETSVDTGISVGPENRHPSEKKITRNRLPWFRKQDQPLPPIPLDGEGETASEGPLHSSNSGKPAAPPSPAGYWDVLGEFVASPPPKGPTHAISAPSDMFPFRASLDKPLPQPPPVFHRPLPQRSGRRHMENTAQWPTAGVLIHDHTPSITENDGTTTVIPSRPPAIESTSSKFVLLPTGTDGGSSLSSQRKNGVSRKAKGKAMLHSQAGKAKKLKELPRTIQEEPEVSPKYQKRSARGLYRRIDETPGVAPPPPPKDIIAPSLHEQKSKANPHPDSAPKLPRTWEGVVDSSSSFEKALDGIIQMLNDMDQRRQQERMANFEAARGLSSATKISPKKRASPKKPGSEAKSNDCSHTASGKPHTPSPSAADLALDKQTSGSGNVSSDDRDIDDKDILHSLRMAVCAACNEELDAWIRSKTGLRLRRFLADLRTFEDLQEDEEEDKSITSRPKTRSTSTARMNGQRKRRSRVEKRRSRNESGRLTENGRRHAKKKSGNNCFNVKGDIGSQGYL